jgi:hypothetical protein
MYYIAYLGMNTEQLFVIIPMTIIYIFLAHTRDAILFSDTVLGKCIAVSIIAFYSSISEMYGILVCLLILVYYQSDLVEEILNTERSDEMEMNLVEMNREIQASYGEPLWARVSDETTIAKNVAVISAKPAPEKLHEGFTPGDSSLYSYKPPTQPIQRFPDKPDKKQELMDIFRKEHCVNGVLLHRGVDVHPEMTEHIFREFKPDGYSRCNPCDTNCSFSIIEERFNTEKSMHPVSSNDFFQSNIEYMKSVFGESTDNFTAYFSGDRFDLF